MAIIKSHRRVGVLIVVALISLVGLLVGSWRAGRPQRSPIVVSGGPLIWCHASKDSSRALNQYIINQFDSISNNSSFTKTIVLVTFDSVEAVRENESETIKAFDLVVESGASLQFASIKGFQLSEIGVIHWNAPLDAPRATERCQFFLNNQNCGLGKDGLLSALSRLKENGYKAAYFVGTRYSMKGTEYRQWETPFDYGEIFEELGKNAIEVLPSIGFSRWDIRSYEIDSGISFR